MKRNKILSILVLPIFVKETFYGFIGFDDCTRERKWNHDQLIVIRSLGTNIANAVRRIQNENIIKEYDAIKNYFSNVLKTKKINVVASITTVDDIVTEKNARSNEIDKIDKTLIEEVKFKVISVARRKEEKSDQQVFTMEEYLSFLTDRMCAVCHIRSGRHWHLHS